MNENNEIYNLESKLFNVMEMYTRPAGHNCLWVNGKEDNVQGNYIVINSDGWIVTAAHILKPDLKPARSCEQRATAS